MQLRNFIFIEKPERIRNSNKQYVIRTNGIYRAIIQHLSYEKNLRIFTHRPILYL